MMFHFKEPKKHTSNIPNWVCTWFVNSGANKVCFKRQTKLLQADGALGSRHTNKLWRCRSLLLPCWVSSQALKLCLQQLPLPR